MVIISHSLTDSTPLCYSAKKKPTYLFLSHSVFSFLCFAKSKHTQKIKRSKLWEREREKLILLSLQKPTLSSSYVHGLYVFFFYCYCYCCCCWKCSSSSATILLGWEVEAVQERSFFKEPIFYLSSDEEFVVVVVVAQKVFVYEEVCEVGEGTESSVLHHEAVRCHTHLLAGLQRFMKV